MQIDEYIDKLVESEGQEFVEKLARNLARRGFGHTGKLTVAKITFERVEGEWNRYNVTLAIDADFSITDKTHSYGSERLIRRAASVLSLGGWKRERGEYDHQVWTVLDPSDENIRQLKALWRGFEWT